MVSSSDALPRRIGWVGRPPPQSAAGRRRTGTGSRHPKRCASRRPPWSAPSGRPLRSASATWRAVVRPVRGERTVGATQLHARDVRRARPPALQHPGGPGRTRSSMPKRRCALMVLRTAPTGPGGRPAQPSAGQRAIPTVQALLGQQHGRRPAAEIRSDEVRLRVAVQRPGRERDRARTRSAT